MTDKLDNMNLCTIEYNNYNSFPRLYNNVHALQFGATGVAAKTGSKIVGALATVATSNNDNMPRLTHRVEPAPATREIGVLKPKIAANIKGALGSMVGATADEYIRSGYVPTKLFSLVNVVQALVRNHNFSKKDDAESQLLSQDVWAMPKLDPDTGKSIVKSIHRFPYLVFKDNPLLMDDEEDGTIKLKPDTVSSMGDFQKSIAKEIENANGDSKEQLEKLKRYVDSIIFEGQIERQIEGQMKRELSRNDYLSITILFTNYREYKRNKEAIEKIKTKMRNIIKKYISAKDKAEKKIEKLKKTLDALVPSGSNQQAGAFSRAPQRPLTQLKQEEKIREKIKDRKKISDYNELKKIYSDFNTAVTNDNGNKLEMLQNKYQNEVIISNDTDPATIALNKNKSNLKEYINLRIFVRKMELTSTPENLDELNKDEMKSYLTKLKNINLLDEKEIITSEEEKFYSESKSYTLPQSVNEQQGEKAEKDDDVIDIVLKIDHADLIEPVLVMSEYSNKNKTIKMDNETQRSKMEDLYETAFKAWARSAPYKLGLLSVIRDEPEKDQQKNFSKRIDYLWNQYNNVIKSKQIDHCNEADKWQKVCCKALKEFKEKVEANKKKKPKKEAEKRGKEEEEGKEEEKEEEKEVSEEEVKKREAASAAAAEKEEEQNKQSEKKVAEAQKKKNTDGVTEAYEGILQKDISQWLDRMYFGSRRSGNFTEKSAIMIDSSSEDKGQKGNKDDGIYEYPLYIAGTDGYESGWVYFNKNDANEIKLRLLSLFAGEPKDVDKFLTDVTGLESPLSLRVQHIDLRNEAIKSGKKLKIDLDKFKEYKEGVAMYKNNHASAYQQPITGSLPVSPSSPSQKGGLAGRTQNKRIHDIGRVKTLKKEKKKKKKKKEKKEKKEKKLKKKKA